MIVQNIKKVGRRHSHGDDVLHSKLKRFFMGEKSVDLEPYMYTSPAYEGDPVKSSLIYQDLVHNQPLYYVSRNEVELLQDKLPELADQYKDVTHVVDLGPGSTKAILQKTLPILNTLPNVTKYTCVDMCNYFLGLAEDLVETKSPDIHTTHRLHRDMYAGPIPKVAGEKRLFICFGAAIQNTPESFTSLKPYNYIHHLKKLKQSLLPEDTLLLSLDTNQDENTLLEAYDNPTFRDYTLNFLHFINREADVYGLDVNNFRAQTIWHAENHCVASYLIPTIGHSIYLGSDKIDLQKGQLLHVCSSYKYPSFRLLQFFEDAGFSCKASFKTSSTMEFYILQ